MTYYNMDDYSKALEYFNNYKELVPEDEESTRYYIKQLGLMKNASMKFFIWMSMIRSKSIRTLLRYFDYSGFKNSK